MRLLRSNWTKTVKHTNVMPRLAWILCLYGGIVASTSYGFEAAPQKPQEVNVPIDISRSETSITTDIKITEHRPYNFYLNIYYKDSPDLHRVMRLTGDGSRYPDGRYGRPGIVVPLHVKVTNTSGAVVYDEIGNAQGVDIHGFGWDKDGYLSRLVGGVELRPGVYRIQVSTIKKTPEFFDTRCTFSIRWHPNTEPLAD
jgi:hypothetical protein